MTLTHHVVLCIVGDLVSEHVRDVINYTVVDIMTVGNTNLCVVLFRSLCYSRMYREGAECLYLS